MLLLYSSTKKKFCLFTTIWSARHALSRLSSPVWNCTLLFCAKRGEGWRQIENAFLWGGEFLPPLPSNSVIIILSNYILLSSLPGGRRRRSSPLPADDREAILQACDQRHNDLLQRLQRRAVFQQQPGPELAVEWLWVGSIGLIKPEPWLTGSIFEKLCY